MKIILSYLTLFLLFTNSHLYAQVDPKVYVKGTECSTQYDGGCFYNLEPTAGSYSRVYYYVPVVVFDPSTTVPTYATQTYAWTVVGGTLNGQTTNQQIGVTWNNTANYNMGTATKTIRLKITFSWVDGTTNKTKEINSIMAAGGGNSAQPIEVKYISTPSSITFNSSTLSNGNSLLYACGTSSKTVSVPAVTTDPSGSPVTYYFYYPSGWSGPASSSSPSVTVTPHISSGGTIAVEAKRNDSNLRTKISITITRPLPTTPTLNTGDILLCNPQTITATSANATSFNWVTTGGISASSPGNTSSAYITGTADGTVKVSASSSVCAYTTGYSVERNVKKSAPKPSALFVYNNIGGQPDFMCRGTGVQLSAYTDEPGTSFGNWTTSDPANTYLYYSGGSATFNTYINNCYGIDVTASNCFGSVQKGITICVDDCGARSVSYTVFPNPARDVINIEFDESSEATNLPETIKLYSETSGKEVKTVDTAKSYSDNSFKSSKTLSIKVDDLPRGTYYLHLGNEKGDVRKIRILLE